MSNIKINDVPQRIQYDATAGQTQFTVPFPFFQSNFVYVWLNGVQMVQGGGAGQYTVSGAGSPSGGLVTFNTAAALHDIVTIEGIMPIDRTSIYSATISNLTGSDLNGDFNREVVMLQQLNTNQEFMQLSYAPWAEVSQDLSDTTDRYIPILPPGYSWRKNDAGTAIEAFAIPSSGFSQDAKFIVQEASSSLPNAFSLGTLTNGIIKQTVSGAIATPAIALLDTDYYGPGMSGYLEAPAGVKDANGNILQKFESVPSAVNYLVFANTLSGAGPIIGVDGADSDIQMIFITKGTDPFIFNAAAPSPITINSGTAFQHETTLFFADTAASRSVTFQDADGTVAFLSDIPAGSPSALTKIDDTNVTLTLGGTPATALLEAVSLTLGWTGTLSGTRGGTGVNNGANTLTLAGNLATSGAFASTFTMTGATNVTFPTSGTLATTSQLPTPAALTKVDDTNITLTLGGTPATALLEATSITAGWTGQLAPSRGGTGISSLGTGVATALGQNVTGSGGMALANGPTFVTSTVTAPSITFSTTSGVIGTTTNNNAAAGSVGELISSVISSGSAVSFTNNTNKDVTSISLTAGDWDVYGNIFYQFSIGASAVYCWISQTSATLPNLSLVNALNGITNCTLGGISAPYFRASLSGTTTIYLSGLASFGSGTGTGCGGIYARRVR